MNYICNSCNNCFYSIKAIEFHKKICIYYNYTLDNCNSNLTNNQINSILLLSNNNNNIISVILFKSHLLQNILFKLNNKSLNINNQFKLLQLYYIIFSIGNEYILNDYYLYIISIILQINIIDINNVLTSYNTCKLNILF